ncbi:MAG: outer membrane protein assembly factor BamC [Gammaproteobacteria bacterium]|nr:outer membrane protein assembly factor BamC [Gammaproteobacteria bacterium]
MKHSFLKVSACLLAALLASGCETINEKRHIDYGNTQTLPPLDVPPGMSGPDQSTGANAATYSNYAGDQKTTAPAADATVLPQYPEVKLGREGQTRFLIVQAKPEQLWDSVREFVLQSGLLIEAEDQTAGTIETEWAESRDLLVKSSLTNNIAKFFSSLTSSSMRDKYRLRLEHGLTPGTTEIYVSQRGLEQDVQGTGRGASAKEVYWHSRPNDPALEAQLLQHLAAHIAGGMEKPATKAVTAAIKAEVPPPNASLGHDNNGAPLLTLQDSLDRAWRRVGLSLDRVGFTVEDRDRSKGVYYVRYIDPDTQTKKGWFSGWLGSEEPAKNQYQVHLQPIETGTTVAVLNKDGAPEATKIGERILSLLQEQLK